MKYLRTNNMLIVSKNVKLKFSSPHRSHDLGMRNPDATGDSHLLELSGCNHSADCFLRHIPHFGKSRNFVIFLTEVTLQIVVFTNYRTQLAHNLIFELVFISLNLPKQGLNKPKVMDSHSFSRRL